MFVQTIYLWRTGATQTIFCRYIVGDVELCKLCFKHSWRHRWCHQVKKWVKFWKWYISVKIWAKARTQNSGHFKNCEILNTASIWPQIWTDRPKLCQKSIFMMLTSLMTSQGGLRVGPLYSFINEIITFFMNTKQRAKISSLNFLCICIIRLWLQLYEYIFMTSFMTSPSQKIGQILKLIYLRQYLN